MLIAATLAGLGLMMLLGCPTAFGLETSEKMGVMGVMGIM